MGVREATDLADPITPESGRPIGGPAAIGITKSYSHGV